MSSNPVYITRIASVLPNAPVGNDKIEAVLGMAGGQKSRAKNIVLRSNKIKERHYAISPESGEYTHTNASLAASAVRGLFPDSDELNTIECLVASSSLPDQLLPSHGAMVHGELKNPPCEVVSTSGVCLCGISALKYAYLNIKAGEAINGVVVASELASNTMHARNFDAEVEHKLSELESRPEVAFEKDFLRWMLSDGAGAALLSTEPEKGALNLRIDWIDMVSYANELEACMYAGAEKIDGELKSWMHYTSDERGQQSIMSIKQDVRLLNENIVKYTVEHALKKSIQKRGLQAENYDFFVPHYSSDYFRERVATGLNQIDFHIPFEKWFTNLSKRGNTGSASIFIMLDDLVKSGKLKAGHKLLCYIPESGRFSSGFIQLTVQ